ncbi:hypothetical protein M758_UG264800 [Ceratodon purpureus]|nr:hypothetical protein M758_UG264800 [Ceratodon purpureus]
MLCCWPASFVEWLLCVINVVRACLSLVSNVQICATQFLHTKTPLVLVQRNSVE